MMIVDCWKQDGRIAVYCTGESVKQLINKQIVSIGGSNYNVVGHDLLRSITGIESVMLLLDTSSMFTTPQEIT